MTDWVKQLGRQYIVKTFVIQYPADFDPDNMTVEGLQKALFETYGKKCAIKGIIEPFTEKECLGRVHDCPSYEEHCPVGCLNDCRYQWDRQRLVSRLIREPQFLDKLKKALINTIGELLVERFDTNGLSLLVEDEVESKR